MHIYITKKNKIAQLFRCFYLEHDSTFRGEKAFLHTYLLAGRLLFVQILLVIKDETTFMYKTFNIRLCPDNFNYWTNVYLHKINQADYSIFCQRKLQK